MSGSVHEAATCCVSEVAVERACMSEGAAGAVGVVAAVSSAAVLVQVVVTSLMMAVLGRVREREERHPASRTQSTHRHHETREAARGV